MQRHFLGEVALFLWARRADGGNVNRQIAIGAFDKNLVIQFFVQQRLADR
jgi:hypothetical protein